MTATQPDHAAVGRTSRRRIMTMLALVGTVLSIGARIPLPGVDPLTAAGYLEAPPGHPIHHAVDRDGPLRHGPPTAQERGMEAFMSSPRPDRTSEGPHSCGFDSRAWTGPEPEPPRPTLDRRGARAVFRVAGGSAAVRPQRVASAFLWIGLGSTFTLALLGPTDVDPWPVPSAWRLEALNLFGLGWPMAYPDAAGRASVVPGPNVLLLVSTLLAGWAGILTAWTCRRALAQGFRAVEADRIGAVFVTRRVDLLAPGIGFLCLTASKEDTISLATLLVLALLSVAAVRAMTAVAERHFAGLGARSPVASRWDVAALGAISAVLATAITRAWAT